jgi:hypothetical protein
VDKDTLHFVFLPLFRPSTLSTLDVTVTTRPTAPVLFYFFFAASFLCSDRVSIVQSDTLSVLYLDPLCTQGANSGKLKSNVFEEIAYTVRRSGC